MRRAPGATHHPVVQSFEPGEDWLWCYVDEQFGEPRDELGAAAP